MRYYMKQCAIKKRNARPLNLAHVTTKWVIVCYYAKFRIVAHLQIEGKKSGSEQLRIALKWLTPLIGTCVAARAFTVVMRSYNNLKLYVSLGPIEY